MVRGSRVAAAYVGRFRLSHGGYWVGHRRFYHPQHEWAGYERALVDFLQLTFCIGAAVAVGSSLALALRWRVAASASVVVCWVGLVLGGAVYLNSVAEGPQYFDRYVGEMIFESRGSTGRAVPIVRGPTGFMYRCVSIPFWRHMTRHVGKGNKSQYILQNLASLSRSCLGSVGRMP